MFNYTSDFGEMLGKITSGERYDAYPYELGEKRDIISEIGAVGPAISYVDFLKHYYLHKTWFIPGLPEHFRKEYSLSDEQEALFELLLENAIVHGNENDPGKPVEIVALRGNHVAVKLTDRGQGFYPRQVQEDFQKGRCYSRGLGIGTRFAAKCTQSLVRYSIKGNSVEVLFLKGTAMPKPYFTDILRY